MLRPTTIPLRPCVEPARLSNGYFLSDVCLNILNSNTAVFTAKLNAPAGSHVWARAWLSNEIDGTLAENESPRLAAGDVVNLTVTLRDSRVPDNGYIRIESAPLATEQVVSIKLL